MASLSDYEGLKQSIIDTLQRNDVDIDEHVVRFIQLCEDDLNDIDHPYFIARTTFEADAQVTLPGDLKALITLSVAGWGPVKYVSFEDFDLFNENGGSGYYYTLMGEEIFFSSQCVGSTINMTFKRNLNGLSVYNPTNWVLQNFPSAYLYGALKHASVWLVEDERLPMWDGLYNQAMASIEKDAVNRSMPLVSSMTKRKVV